VSGLRNSEGAFIIDLLYAKNYCYALLIINILKARGQLGN
jgi:hypothetical protein